MTKIGVTYDTREFNGSLLKENIFRQDASPDVDAAWEALGANCQSRARFTFCSTYVQLLILLFL
jgi:hypothetical protein